MQTVMLTQSPLSRYSASSLPIFLDFSGKCISRITKEEGIFRIPKEEGIFKIPKEGVGV